MSRHAGSATAVRPRWVAWLDDGVRTLYPGYFALDMATGIVSNGFWFLGYRTLSDVLLAIDLVAYPVLVVATLTRLARHPAELWADLVDPRLVFSFFTIVAGSSVLGLQLFLRGRIGIAVALWVVAFAVWIALSYFSFSVLTFLDEEHGVRLVHAGWLLAVVGTESLTLLGVRLAPHVGSLQPLMFVTVYALWGVGIVLYGIFVTLLIHRIILLPLSARDMSPMLWLIMGAAAIATNAGSTMLRIPPDLPFLAALHPFVDGLTLVLWAWATWWIGLLVIFGVWRHLVRRVPLSYHPAYWSLVFPLGMYTLATYDLARATAFSPLGTLPQASIWIAFAAWLITLSGLVRAIVRSRA